MSEPLKQRSVTVVGRRWLTDGNIKDVYTAFRQPDGSALPDSILLLTPAEAHAIGHQEVGDSQEAVFELHLPSRSLVLAPVNDARRTGGGMRWSLLVMWRKRRGDTAVSYCCFIMTAWECRLTPLGQAFLQRDCLGKAFSCRNGLVPNMLMGMTVESTCLSFRS